MAPRTRSNQAEKLAVQKLLSSGISVNTRGLPALPNEIYLEILGHLPALPIPHDVWVDKKTDPLRQLTLYYLSQTCQSLRKFFLKFAWERIEVFGGMWTPMGRLATTAERNKRGLELKQVGDKKLVEEILRQLETVIVRNSDLRQYVSIVNLTILSYSRGSVLPEIAQNLTLFPNLHTLQLIFQFHNRRPLPVFSAFRYPNVQTLNLNVLAPRWDIIQACPNTRHFSFYKDKGERGQIGPLLTSECASGIVKLGVLRYLHHHVTEIVRHFPRLGDLSFDCEDLSVAENFTLLSKLPLHTIRVRLDDWSRRNYIRFHPATPDQRQKWIDLAKRILANCPEHNVAKKVIVVNYDKTVEVYNVWN